MLLFCSILLPVNGHQDIHQNTGAPQQPTCSLTHKRPGSGDDVNNLKHLHQRAHRQWRAEQGGRRGDEGGRGWAGAGRVRQCDVRGNDGCRKCWQAAPSQACRRPAGPPLVWLRGLALLHVTSRRPRQTLAHLWLQKSSLKSTDIHTYNHHTHWQITSVAWQVIFFC